MPDKKIFTNVIKTENRKIHIIILSTVPFLMVLGNSMLIPEFATIRDALNITSFQVSLVVTYFSVAAALAIPFAGYLSDYMGRKIIIIPGLIVYGLGGAIDGLASVFATEPYNIIIAGRIIQGVGAAGTAPVAMALAGDLFKPGERSEGMGIMESGNGIGKVLSPVIGSAVALIIWYALFFAYALLSVIIAFMVWLFVPEPDYKREKTLLPKYLKKMLEIFRKNWTSLLFAFLYSLIILFILFGVLSFTSEILVSVFGIKGLLKGVILSIPLLTLSVASYLTGLYLRKKCRYFRATLLTGMLITGFSLLLLPCCRDSLLIYPVILGLLGLGAGLALPVINTIVTGTAGSEQRGGVTSLYNSIRFLGVASGPPVFLWIGTQGTGMLLIFFVNSVIAFLLGILGYVYVRGYELE